MNELLDYLDQYEHQLTKSQYESLCQQIVKGQYKYVHTIGNVLKQEYNVNLDNVYLVYSTIRYKND